jgi:hypothetical protein
MCIMAFAASLMTCVAKQQRGIDKLIRAVKEEPLYITDAQILDWASRNANESVMNQILTFVQSMNRTFNHSWVSSLIETAQEAPPAAGYADTSGNPHCDVSSTGPRTVTTIEKAGSSNPFNNIPRIPTLDLTQILTSKLEKAQSAPSSQGTSQSMVEMIGMMMVKDLVQSAVATGTAVIPMGIPPPVWNLRPFPCMPMVTGSNCFGAVLYPITFADSVIADVTDSALTGTIKQFRTLFYARAGSQPDHVYQTCFKAFMSMMCGSLFPMCTNPQGQDEMIPFVGRVPLCFTACLMVLLQCPGFGMADIEGPCSDISVPPVCSQAVYLRDDINEDEAREREIEGSLNSKCANYDPLLDAGQDPLLYEEESPEVLFPEGSGLHADIPKPSLVSA